METNKIGVVMTAISNLMEGNGSETHKIAGAAREVDAAITDQEVAGCLQSAMRESKVLMVNGRFKLNVGESKSEARRGRASPGCSAMDENIRKEQAASSDGEPSTCPPKPSCPKPDQPSCPKPECPEPKPKCPAMKQKPKSKCPRSKPISKPKPKCRKAKPKTKCRKAKPKPKCKKSKPKPKCKKAKAKQPLCPQPKPKRPRCKPKPSCA